MCYYKREAGTQAEVLRVLVFKGRSWTREQVTLGLLWQQHEEAGQQQVCLAHQAAAKEGLPEEVHRVVRGALAGEYHADPGGRDGHGPFNPKPCRDNVEGLGPDTLSLRP